MRIVRSAFLSVFLGACFVPALTLGLQAQIVFEADVPPPPLPLYEQPPIPEPGWLWVPGYWAFDDEYGYFWVPGTWIEPPRRGLLWTPGYWAYEHGTYRFFDGYWASQVGFYGGVDYGYGYTGLGYEGGYWDNDRFFYNRTVNNIANVEIANVYSKTVIVNENGPRVSFNGGQGGLAARPTPQQETLAHEQHVQPTAPQQQHVQMAGRDPALRETQNKGRPPVAATPRPADFKGQGVISAQTSGARPAGQTIPQGKTGAHEPGSEPANPSIKPAEKGAGAPHEEHPGQRPQVPAAEPPPAASHEHMPEVKSAEPPHALPPHEPSLHEPSPHVPEPELKHNEPSRVEPREPMPQVEHNPPPKPAESLPRAEPPHPEPSRAQPARPEPQMQVRPEGEPHPAGGMPPHVQQPQTPHPPAAEEHKPEEPHPAEHR